MRSLVWFVVVAMPVILVGCETSNQRQGSPHPPTATAKTIAPISSPAAAPLESTPTTASVPTKDRRALYPSTYINCAELAYHDGAFISESSTYPTRLVYHDLKLTNDGPISMVCSGAAAFYTSREPQGRPPHQRCIWAMLVKPEQLAAAVDLRNRDPVRQLSEHFVQIGNVYISIMSGYC